MNPVRAGAAARTSAELRCASRGRKKKDSPYTERIRLPLTLKRTVNRANPIQLDTHVPVRGIVPFTLGVGYASPNSTMATILPGDGSTAAVRDKRVLYNRFLLLVAGFGGLLYGVDVGIIGGALPYLEATSGLNAGQLSIIVAAVLLGSVISTLFAGLLADWMGRKPLMTLSGITFVISIPIIALAHGYGPLFFGRLLQGISGGLIGVVVPLYLAECLAASNRGKGTGVFPVAADARHRRGGFDRHLLQLPRRSSHQSFRCRYSLCFQGPGLAPDLLGFAPTGSAVCDWHFPGCGIPPLAVPPRQKTSRSCCAAALPHAGTSKLRVVGNGTSRPCRGDQNRRAAQK